MEEQAIFKTAPLGFNRQEVLAYIEKLQQHVQNARSDAEKQVKGESDRLQKLEEAKSDLQNQLQARVERVAEVEGALLDLKRQLDATTAQLEDRERRCTVLSEQVETFRKRINTLTEEMETLKNVPAEQPKVIDRSAELESEIALLRQTVAETEREKTLLSERVRMFEDKAHRYDEASSSIAQAIVEAQKGAQAILAKAHREANEIHLRSTTVAQALLESFVDFHSGVEDLSSQMKGILQDLEVRLDLLDHAADEAVEQAKQLQARDDEKVIGKAKGTPVEEKGTPPIKPQPHKDSHFLY